MDALRWNSPTTNLHDDAGKKCMVNARWCQRQLPESATSCVEAVGEGFGWVGSRVCCIVTMPLTVSRMLAFLGWQRQLVDNMEVEDIRQVITAVTVMPKGEGIVRKRKGARRESQDQVCVREIEMGGGGAG